MKLMKNSALILLVLGLLFNPVNTTLFAGYEAYAEDAQEPVVTLSGTVTEIEKYGHASSDITIEDALKVFDFGDVVTVTFDNGYTKDMPFLDGYYVDNGEHLLRAYPGHRTIAVCINYGKLFEVANVGVGDRFTVSMKEKEGYLEEYLLRKLTRTDIRDDYESDAVFANFRNISYGKTNPNTLYRSSSPVDNRLKRAEYADALMGEAGVKTVINLANKDSEVEAYLADDSFKTPNYQEIKDNGKVKALGLGLAYKSPEFKAGIIEGLKFMAANEGPYLFHCTEGKDRTGFYGALLNALMGATKEEIVADYMKTYVNYYSEIKPEHNEMNSLQYRLIAQDVLGMLKAITGSDNLDSANLQEGAGRYLSSGNMTEAELTQLMKNLSTMSDAEIDQFVERVKVAELPQPTIKKGERITVGGTVYTVLDSNAKTVGLVKAKNTKKVTVPATIKFKDKKLKVVQIKANAFKGTKATKIVIKTKSLKKSKVKGSLKGSKVKTIQVKVGSKKVNKSYVKKYKKIFTKKNAGKKVRVLLK